MQVKNTNAQNENADLYENEDDILSDIAVRNALSEEDYLWPNGIVPYLLSHDYEDKSKALLTKAILEFQNNTCIRFIPRTSEEDYIFVLPGNGYQSFLRLRGHDTDGLITFIHGKKCASYVGRVGGAQIVSLGSGCKSAGIMMHELMHTLGFFHEQSRPDRDNHVIVKWQNIKEGREANFEKWSPSAVRDLGEPYDYGSILHYSRFAFSKNPKKLPTIEPKKRGAKIGQRKTLSKGDINKINKLYKCKLH